MHVAVLAHTLETYATGRLAETLRQRGHQATVAAPRECTLHVAGEILHHGRPLQDLDAVVLRAITYYHQGVLVPRSAETSVARQLRTAGALCFNRPGAKTRAADKLAALQALAAFGIPVPRTFQVWSAAEFERVVRDDLGCPVVIKTHEGTWGVGVVRADSLPSARSVYDALARTGDALLVQQYVAESGREDICALVVGGAVIAAVRWRSPAGDFRSNLAQGGHASLVNLSERLRALAIRAASVLELEVAGVDILTTDAGEMVLEVNPVPGLRAFDEVNGIDTAAAIVDRIETCHRGTARGHFA